MNCAPDVDRFNSGGRYGRALCGGTLATIAVPPLVCTVDCPACLIALAASPQYANWLTARGIDCRGLAVTPEAVLAEAAPLVPVPSADRCNHCDKVHVGLSCNHCGHDHAGRSLGGICIGCTCPHVRMGDAHDEG